MIQDNFLVFLYLSDQNIAYQLVDANLEYFEILKLMFQIFYFHNLLKAKEI